MTIAMPMGRPIWYFGSLSFSFFFGRMTTTTTTTKPLIPNKLGYTRNKTQSESTKSKISNISDNNKYDERKGK
jgi:hypothetical protein